jgi:hypothetical protein
MQYSLIDTWILDHPTRIQIGIRKQVRITKNKEIPSRPIKKWSDDDVEINGKRSVVNWNLAVELSKRTHRSNERINVIDEVPNEVTKILRLSQLGKNRRIPHPIKGRIITQ